MTIVPQSGAQERETIEWEDERVVKTVQFSARTNWNTEESALAQAYRERKNSGKNVIDLTASNPTLCGFEYPEKVLAPLSDTASLNYDPNPKGSLSAREAVSRYYADAGALINPDSILLTTSTSEAYGYLFKLLCDFDNEVLVPQPSYPLFDFLADAEGVKIVATPLVFDHGWQIDFETLRRRINGRTRAIVLVHPNNPTGHFVQAWESRELERLCREHNLALIVDEVFLDYAFGSATASDRCSFAARGLNCLVFIVSGMSKIAGLPQVKSAWLAALGPGSEHALERLEVLADTYLSVSSPVQFALPKWIETRPLVQRQIRERTGHNLLALDRILDEQDEDRVLVNRLAAEGGWYAVLRIPAWQDDEATVKELLDLGVWIHPGYFFGFGRSGWLVLSLLGKPEEFVSGVNRMLEYFVRTIRVT